MPRPDFTNSGSPTMRAQLVEQVADRRLGDVQPLRRAGDRALLDHRQQQLQQVAVEVQMIELAHGDQSGIYPVPMRICSLGNELIQNQSRNAGQYARENAMPTSNARQPVPGTTIFDGEQARKGYALNKMCYSFNDAANRQAFVADEDAYCARYGLNAEQREPIRNRNVLQLIEAGGNAYYLAKFAGIFGLDMQDIGAQQTGLTKDEFKAKLVAGPRRSSRPHGKDRRRHHHLARPRDRRGHRQGPAERPLLEAVLRRLPAGARMARQSEARRHRACSTTITA